MAVTLACQRDCAVPENIHTPPRKVFFFVSHPPSPLGNSSLFSFFFKYIYLLLFSVLPIFIKVVKVVYKSVNYN